MEPPSDDPDRTARARAEMLRRGRDVPDLLFDQVYPPDVARLSRRFWTPVRVVRRACALLGVTRGSRVLDVGAGAGKFCLVGALCTPGEFVGVEQRGGLVAVARATGARLGAARASFVHGDAGAHDWRGFDGVYLFNPFAENYFEPGAQIDAAVDLSWERYANDVAAAEAKLATLEPGARVVTYHGFGGAFPRGFEPCATEQCASGTLELWVRRRD